MPTINSTGWLIIIIFVAFIIIINIWLLFNSRNNNSKSGIFILRNAFKDPFQDENNKLEELSKLTAKFKEMEQKKSEEDSGEKNAK